MYGSITPRLLRIYSPNSDQLFGIGDAVDIVLEFTAPVNVEGIPTLTVNSGCHYSTCTTNEVQYFTCYADLGKFAIRLQNQFIMNINANSTRNELKQKLEELNGIENVSIKLNSTTDIKSSSGDRLCTSNGKGVEITFLKVSFPQYNGNVPPLYFDYLNEYTDVRTNVNQGIKKTSLIGVNQEYRPQITSSEIQSGFQKNDGLAYYVSGSGRNQLLFRWIVEEGDSTSNLDVVSINYGNGSLHDPIGNALISTYVPIFGAGPRYMTQSASSLSYNSIVAVTSAIPTVVSVTSPTYDGTYTVGDRIFIRVTFSLSLKLVNPTVFTLQLSTGTFNRFASFYNFRNSTTLQFLYTVQTVDSTSGLDYLSINALHLNGGAIYRNAAANTSAIISLPVPGSFGSLSFDRFIIIDTNPPTVLKSNVLVSSGIYTAGDNVDIALTFSDVVTVRGNPRIWLHNTPRLLDAVIRNAPSMPTFSFSTATPGDDAQIKIYLKFNFPMSYGDQIKIYLPEFNIHPGINSDLTERFVYLSGPSSSLYSGLWKVMEYSLYLSYNSTTNNSSSTTINLIVDGRSGLFSSTNGIISASNNLKYNFISSKVNVVSDYLFDNVGAIGFETLSLAITPARHDSNVNILFSFTVPELLYINDQIIFYFYNFKCDQEMIYLPSAFDNGYLSVNWQYNSTNLITYGILTLTVIGNTTIVSDNLNLTRYIPLQIPTSGVNSNSVLLSTIMNKNGNVKKIQFPFINKICGFEYINVLYLNKFNDIKSAVKITWLTQFQLEINDEIEFRLPGNSSTISIVTFASGSCTGVSCEYFTGFLLNNVVKLTVLSKISSNTPIDFTLIEVLGIKTPLFGIISGYTAFQVILYTVSCEMKLPQRFLFSYGIIPVYSTSVVLTNYNTLTSFNHTVLVSIVNIDFK